MRDMPDLLVSVLTNENTVAPACQRTLIREELIWGVSFGPAQFQFCVRLGKQCAGPPPLEEVVVELDLLAA